MRSAVLGSLLCVGDSLDLSTAEVTGLNYVARAGFVAQGLQGWSACSRLRHTVAPAPGTRTFLADCRPASLLRPALHPSAGDKLVQLVFEALDTATSGDTGHQEEVAAKRVMDKAHTKVCAASVQCGGWTKGLSVWLLVAAACSCSSVCARQCKSIWRTTCHWAPWMYVRRLPTSLLRPASRLSTHAQAIAGRRRREIQSRYMFTKPLTPVAGQPVEIYYNPGGRCWWTDSVSVCVRLHPSRLLVRVTWHSCPTPAPPPPVWG